MVSPENPQRTLETRNVDDQARRLDDVEDLREYRSLSPLAVASLLFGLASALALTQIILLAIPILGLAASCLALARMARTGASGRTLALIGLVLSVFFGTLAITQYTARQAILRSYARRAADQWLALVQAGRLHEAHQWVQAASIRVGRDELLKAYYDQHLTMTADLSNMFRRSGFSELSRFGKAVTVQYVDSRNVGEDREQQVFEIDYIVEYQQTRIPIQVRVVRRWNPDFLRQDWIVGPSPEKDPEDG